MSSPAAIYEVCVPDVFHGIVPVRGLKTTFRRIDGSLIMELNNRFMNKRLFPFLFLLSLFAFASLPAYQSCHVEAVTVSTDTNRKEVSKRANQRGQSRKPRGGWRRYMPNGSR